MGIASKRGSANVEAAMILPVLILIIAGMISCSFTLMGRVKDASDSDLEKHEKFMTNMLFTTEDLLRGKWAFS